jgi:hypothetical protein
MMFTGPTSKVVPWFSTTLGYAYDPTLHGVTSDWVMDLVSVAFSKPKVRDACSSHMRGMHPAVKRMYKHESGSWPCTSMRVAAGHVQA